MIKLSSIRFFLRELSLSDATPLYLSWLQNSESSRFIVYKQNSIAELQQYIQNQVDDQQTLFLGVFVRSTNQHIGNVKFTFNDKDKKNIMMGIMIGDVKWHGKGVAGEVLTLFADHAKTNYHSKKMILGVEKANKPAIRAYEKLGFEISEIISKPPSYIMVWDFDSAKSH
jgi:RimJ/RimL family protein N-acetyltransferase